MEFEWNTKKEMENIKKHGVCFLEAIETFSDPNGIQLVDVKNSDEEKRYYWVGKTIKGRVLTTRFTFRDETFRIFGSAEWRKFRRLYYEATKNK
ncbi:MAG: BrnT family toxin [Deltaproteobacteria bacterium]|nr:BrnT family toxin [Deltaproteobacteria bacterium]